MRCAHPGTNDYFITLTKGDKNMKIPGCSVSGIITDIRDFRYTAQIKPNKNKMESQQEHTTGHCARLKFFQGNAPNLCNARRTTLHTRTAKNHGRTTFSVGTGSGLQWGHVKEREKSGFARRWIQRLWCTQHGVWHIFSNCCGSRSPNTFSLNLFCYD